MAGISIGIMTEEERPKSTVHVVDDDESIRTSVSRLLRAAGYEVRGYASAGEFSLTMSDHLTGCILLDVRMPGPSGLNTSAMQMILGGVAVGVIALVRGERIPLDAPAEAWLAVLYLMVAGSLIAFTAYAWLLRNTRPAVATSYAFVNPAIAVIVGAMLGGEALGVSTIAATGLIVAAVAIVIVGKSK